MKELIIHNMPQLPFAAAEALNQLRINLGFCGDQIRTIMMTSSVPNEGKSFLTIQLWRQMAQVGSAPVLLLDCDFRNSEMRRKYGIRSAGGDKLMGAAHYLAGKAGIQDVIYKTNIPNGYMIPVASTIANPTILLENPRFAQMVAHCAGQFGTVLIDTPPLCSVADGLNVARCCDGSVLVVRSGSTSRRLVRHSTQLLRRTDTPLLGMVLNRADTGSRASAYYQRYYGSNDYGYGRSHSHNTSSNGGTQT